jgi:hypothetical protein
MFVPKACEAFTGVVSFRLFVIWPAVEMFQRTISFPEGKRATGEKKKQGENLYPMD